MKLKKLMAAALTLGLLCLTFIPASMAAEGDYAVTARIPVSVAATGAVPEKAETYAVALTAADKTAPMPEKTTLSVTDTDDAAFSIAYTEPGVYRYEVTQTAGADTTAAYDETVYAVTVTVFNNDKGGLSAEVAIRKSGEEAKQDAAAFTNDYTVLTDVTAVKVWAGEDKNRPSSVTVQLYDGAEKCGDEVTLSAENNWTYTWKGLVLKHDTEHAYSVQEVSVPDNYKVTYAVDGTITTITNTYVQPAQKLIQTGQLNWPIPVMACVGVALVAAGILLTRKKQDDA